MKTILKSAARLTLCAGLLLPLVNADVRPASADFTLTPAAVESVLDGLMKERMDALHIPGAAVVVTKGSEIYFSKGYGYADTANQVPMDPARTRIPIGSLTKSVTASAAMQLVEAGRLDLKQDINTYLRTFQAPTYGNTPITLHDLLTHTSGLDQAVYGVNGRTRDSVLDAQTFLRRYFEAQPPVRAPGEKYEYSNAGLGLVGHLVELTSGQPLADYYKQRLFGPLKMPNATLELPLGDPQLAKSYSFAKGTYKEIPYSYIALPGAGGLSVVPNEFANYLIAHLNGGQAGDARILKPESVEAMHAKQYAADPQLDGIGYGFFRGRTAEGIPKLYHTGEIDGFVSELVLIPSEKVGIFVAVNGAGSDVQLHEEVLEALSAHMTAPPQPLDPSATASAGGMGIASAAIDTAALEGEYQAGINPKHGWGKWLRFFGGFSSEVEAADSSTLQVTGTFADSPKEQTKAFKYAGDGLFQEVNGQEMIRFHEVGGKMAMTLSDHTTLEMVSFLHRTWTLLSIYAAGSLVFVGICLIWLVRYGIHAIRKAGKPVSGAVAAIALLNTVFLAVQFTYGNNQLTYGYAPWYAWGISSLPLVSAVLALWLLWQLASGRRAGGWTGWKTAFSLMTLGFTGFLYYWNFLPLHYS
ncbi:serine hydrolase domain-containing protein [Paenibacillus sp. S-38]|uniref:serine hydrolase domain-containing protein n=1 Tax=Paenibacillus sp. S-38 TaxID=3416710 RepID=UPI003CF4AEB8